MRKRTFLTPWILILSMLLLSGCKRTSEDVAEWKEAGNINKLAAATGDRQQFIRLEAIDALAALQDEKTIQPLAALFTDKDLVVAHRAVEAVAGMASPEIEYLMLQALDFDTAPPRVAAAQALGRIKSDRAFEPLLTALDDVDEEVVVAAINALGRIGNKEAIPPLADKVRHRSFEIRMASIEALGRLGGVDAAAALAPALGDLSGSIRSAAVDRLVAQGDAALPLAIEALHSPDPLTRQGGVMILNQLHAVPTKGGDAVWYKLATLTDQTRPEVCLEEAAHLAAIEGSLYPLIEALSHAQPEIRCYAQLALRELGADASAKALKQAKRRLNPEGEALMQYRQNWSGASTWQMDLWCAAVILNPHFSFQPRTAKRFRPHSSEALMALGSEALRAKPEHIPCLIQQFASIDKDQRSNTVLQQEDHVRLTLFGLNVLSASEKNAASSFDAPDLTDSSLLQDAKTCRQLAIAQLEEAGATALLPLEAALYDPDLQIAAYAVHTLDKILGELAEEPIAEALSHHLENHAELADSPFYDSLLTLESARLEPLLQKIRPSKKRAVYVVQKHYPEIHFRSEAVRVDPEIAKKAAPFLLTYYDEHRQRKELRIVFRPDSSGTWALTSPLTDLIP